MLHGRYISKPGGYSKIPTSEPSPIDQLVTYCDDTASLAWDLRGIAGAARTARREDWPKLGRSLREALERNHIWPTHGGQLAGLIERLEKG